MTTFMIKGSFGGEFNFLSKKLGNWWNVMTFAPFFCPYYVIYVTIQLSLKFLGYSVDISSNPMKMYLMFVSQYLCDKWLLPHLENFPNDIYRKNISQMKITIL